MTLTEKHRPSRLSGIVGQSCTVQSVQSILARGFTGGAFYFEAPPGTGKTTLARCIVAELSIEPLDVTIIGGADCTVDFIRSTVDNFALSTWGESGWKAVIVDEAHCMTDRAIEALKPLLEDIAAGRPNKRLFIFTSHKSPELFGDCGALQSRCQYFKLDADPEAFAVHAAKIAADEGLNGLPLDDYRTLIAQCSGNLRMAISRIQSGEMLRKATNTPPSYPAVPSKHTRAAHCAAPAKLEASKPSKLSDSLDTRIKAELAYGAKFLPGSPKFKAHKERLAALESERAK